VLASCVEGKCTRWLLTTALSFARVFASSPGAKCWRRTDGGNSRVEPTGVLSAPTVTGRRALLEAIATIRASRLDPSNR